MSAECAVIPDVTNSLKVIVRTVGARVRTSLLFGMVAQTREATPGDKDRVRAYRAGELPARSRQDS